MSDKSLMHYGTPRHSGRYPWGSGKKYQRSRTFMTQYAELKKKGLTEKEIAEGLGLKNTSELRSKRAQAREEADIANILFVSKLHAKGMSNTAIAKRLGTTEGTVRNLLKKDANSVAKDTSITNIAKTLGEQIREKKFVDIGKGTNLYINTTETKFKDSLSALEQQGYQIIYPQIQQLGTNHKTTFKIMIPPGMDKVEAYNAINADKSVIQTLNEVKVQENGHAPTKIIHDPINIDSSRINVRYAEQGGKNKDGVIEIRPGVPDLDMGNSHYAQVRIAVDGTHYLKGMAIYSNDIPDGYDIVFNTNKLSEKSKLDTMKKQNLDDKHNPFGATIDRQNDYTDQDGKEHQGALNIVREEGSWNEWSRNLASQFLSKQPLALAKKQLNLAAEQKENEFEMIDSLTNPTLKKQLMREFADECDSAAVCLKGAALPRQATKVILPVPSLSDKEVYAPDYEDGEEVILVRYPHGGRFEIPRLTVNNNNKEAKQNITPAAQDAIGINPKVAEQLSGADFDGDTVVIIPTKGFDIRSADPIKELQEFDPKEKYARPEGTKPPWKKGSTREQLQMGVISNLITDMTLADAPAEDIIRAVKHSMTIIDTGKHNLDYKASYEDNGIAALKEKYRGSKVKGASTLISRASGETDITQRDPNRPYSIDKETGKKIFNYKPELWYDKKVPKEERDPDAIKKAQARIKNGEPVGEVAKSLGLVERTVKSTQMYETDDAYTLSSGRPMETVYAEYANRMKALGDKARKVAANTQDIEYNASAARVYSTEVASLKEKIRKAEMNSPLERSATALANAQLELKMQDNPGMTKDEIKKAKNQALREARRKVGAEKYKISITDSEWEAIQTGAVNKTTLRKLLIATDSDVIKQRALPKNGTKMSPAMISRAKLMFKSGYTTAEIAKALDVSVPTLKNNVGKFTE